MRFSLCLTLWMTMTCLYGQKSPEFLVSYNSSWVDSVFNQLTLDQKIGQLLMPRGNYSGRPHNIEQLREWVVKYKIGGVVFFASSPVEQARITNELQALSDVPLFIGQDLEWGLGMRLDSTHRFPYNMTIGATPIDEETLYSMGKEIGQQCKRMGVHINYAPVVDVNNNPNNPVINFRSFGSDKEVVAKNGLALMLGMQSQHILCTAKHFPGHGDTDTDSHFDLPVISHNRERLDDIELYPFKTLIQNGLSGIMTAHLNIPALEPTVGLASTFSYNIVFKLLREELKFQGLTFTDAMEMEGAVKNYPKGESMVRALMAGNDILETFIDVPIAVQAIKQAILDQRLSMEVINSKVKKILRAKSWVGLDQYQPIKLKNLTTDLNTIESDVINHKITQNSITCLKNDLNLLPVKDLTQKVAVVSIGLTEPTDFYKMVDNYTKADFYALPHNADDVLIESVFNSLSNYDIVLATGHFTDIRASKRYGLTSQNTKILIRLASMDQVILSILGSPFILASIPELSQCKTLLMAYQQSAYTESIVPQVIFGALPTYGKLPLNLNTNYYYGLGISLPAINRLSYTIPELAGLQRESLYRDLDSVIYSGFKAHAYPGCVLQVAKDGKVIFNKAYGYHTYEDFPANFEKESDVLSSGGFIDDAMDNDMKKYVNPIQSVQASTQKTELGKVVTNDIYDLASLTKITASALALMELVSEDKINVYGKLSDYLPSLKSSPMGSIILRDALTHRSGLKPWIPFWKDAIDTMATMKKAFIQNPQLNDLATYHVKKPGFFKRLFGKKGTVSMDTIASVVNNPTLWNLALNEHSRTWKKNIFSDRSSVIYSVPVAKNMFLNSNYINTIKQSIKDTPLGIPGVYAYSDLNFYFYPEMIQNLTGQSFESYLQKTYSSLGSHNFIFNPWKTLSTKDIVPTEYDSIFRQQLLQGYVHDEGAAMMGGISGHAGLFGSANDVMKLMQMYLQGGTYGQKTYIKPNILKQFTSYQFPEEKNRRGLVFDKKDFVPDTRNIPTLTSEQAFGHSGYTGTYTWVDPKYGLVYVFLSNRVYPTRNNNAINDLNIRATIGDILIKHIQNSQH